MDPWTEAWADRQIGQNCYLDGYIVRFLPEVMDRLRNSVLIFFHIQCTVLMSKNCLRAKETRGSTIIVHVVTEVEIRARVQRVLPSACSRVRDALCV